MMKWHTERERERRDSELSNSIISNDQFRRPIKNYTASHPQRQFYLRVYFNEKFLLRLRSVDLRNELPSYLFVRIDI